MARYDLITLIEVRTDAVGLEKMKEILKRDFGLEYELFVSEPIGAEKERYGYMWRADRVAMQPGGFVFDDKKDDFVREAYCAPFKSLVGASPAKLVLCSNHAIFGDSVDARQAEASKQPLVYGAATAALPGFGVVLVGDFNLPPEDAAWAGVKALGLTPTNVAPKKTTVGDVSLYDNLWLPPALVARTPNAKALGAVYPFEKYWLPPDSIDITKRTISDHRCASVCMCMRMCMCACCVEFYFIFRRVCVCAFFFLF